jgi:DNA-binding MarR family transcriptional regulator
MIEIKMSRDRAQLENRLVDVLRRTSAQSVLVSQTVAAKLGLHSTDMECLDILQIRGSASAGEIAELTGLTTGAVTALLDRLEKAGYIARRADPSDRRRVLVVPKAVRIAHIGKLFAPLEKHSEALLGNYSVAQLRTIIEFLEESGEIASDFVKDLRQR